MISGKIQYKITIDYINFITLHCYFTSFFYPSAMDLPTAWNVNDKSDYLNLSSDGLEVNHTGERDIDTFFRITIKFYMNFIGIKNIFTKFI